LNTSKKIAITIVVIFAIAAGALAVQVLVMRVGGGQNVSAAQMEAYVATMSPQELAQVGTTDEQHKNYAEGMKRLLAVAQQATAEGFDRKDPNMADNMKLQNDIMLAQEYQAWAQRNNKTAAVTDDENKNYEKAHPGEFDKFFEQLQKNNPRFAQAPPEQKESIRKQYNELMVLVQRAKDQKLDSDPGVQLKLRVTKAEAIVQPYIQELQTKLTVPPDQVQKYYDEHRAEFEQVKARHILISTGSVKGEDGQSKPVDKEAARKKAEDLLKQVKAGKDFITLAKENTDEPQGKTNGGDLGYFSKGKMVPQFEDAAFALQPGQISDIVESPFGFHIIKVEDRKPAPIEDVKQEIEEKLKVEVFKKKIDEIVAKSHIKVAENFKVTSPSGVQALPGAPPAGHP
jgi:parvulin-like peptidyl-prolyl isomerase